MVLRLLKKLRTKKPTIRAARLNKFVLPIVENLYCK